MNQADQINIGKQIIINNPTGPIVTGGSLPKAPVFANVPARPSLFVGREAIMAEIVARLTQQDAPVAISTQGMGGVGKTTLATMIAYHEAIRAHFSDGILWAGLGSQGEAMSQLAQWGDALGLDVRATPDYATRHAAIKNRLGQGKYLLIIDDVWNEQTAQWLKCGGPNCRHVLTTRDEILARKFALVQNSLALTGLAPDEALQLLTAFSPEAVQSNPELARALLQQVGYLPLAIELLGGFLQEAIFAAERAQALQTMTDPQARLQLAQARLGSHTLGQVVPLAEVVRLSLYELPDPCREAFMALGTFAAKPATFSLEAALAVTAGEAGALSPLVRRNLLERLSDTELALHPVIADVARLDQAAHPMLAEWQINHAAYYVAEADKDRNDWHYIATIYPQLQQAWQVAPHKGKLAIIWVTSRYQGLQGLWSDLQPWFEQALTFAEGEDKGTLLNSLSTIYYNYGEYETALSYMQQSLTVTREIGDHEGEGITLNNLSQIYQARGDYETALSYLQQSLTLTREIGDHEGEGTALNNLSQIYQARGEYETAVIYLQQSMTVTREIGDKKGEGIILNNLSLIYMAQGDYERALSYLQQSLTIMLEIGDKAGEGTTLNNLFGIAYERGDYERALSYLQQSLTIQREIGDKRGEGITLSNLSQIFQDRGEYERALSYLQQSLTIQREIGDKRGEGTTLNNLSQIYEAGGNSETALSYLQQSLTIKREIGDQAGWCASMFNLGLSYWTKGEQGEAIAAWVAVYRVASEIQLAQALQALAGLAEDLGWPGGLGAWAALAERTGGATANGEWNE